MSQTRFYYSDFFQFISFFKPIRIKYFSSPTISRRDSEASDDGGIEASLPGSPTTVDTPQMTPSVKKAVTTTPRTTKSSPVKKIESDAEDNDKYSFFRNMTDGRNGHKTEQSPVKVRQKPFNCNSIFFGANHILSELTKMASYECRFLKFYRKSTQSSSTF